VRVELLAQCRAEQIEPPAAGHCDRIIRSALHQAEQALTARVTARLGPDASTRLAALAAAADNDEGDGAEPSALALIKSVPGNVSLESMLTEIGKLDAARAAGLPDGLFSGIAPKVVAAWRARAAVEAPSHLRDHPRPLMLTLLTALVYERQREITDTLADLLISTVHRIGARAERKVTTSRGTGAAATTTPIRRSWSRPFAGSSRARPRGRPGSNAGPFGSRWPTAVDPQQRAGGVAGGVAGEVHDRSSHLYRVKAVHHSPMERPMISFMISVVPPKIVSTRVSRYALAIGYSSM